MKEHRLKLVGILLDESARTGLPFSSLVFAMVEARHELQSGWAGYESGSTLKSAINGLEKNIIMNSLVAQKGNITLSAKNLGISRAGLILKVKAHGLGKMLDEIRSK